MSVNANWCKASNRAGFDRNGNLRKVKRFSGESASPREAAAKCLAEMRAGKSRGTEIYVTAGERDGVFFRVVLSSGPGGTPSWRVPATDEGVASLPETIYPAE